MSFDNNQSDSLQSRKNSDRTSENLIPRYFRTDANKKFLQSTVDQLIKPGVAEKLNAYIGRTTAKAFRKGDTYLEEINQSRQDYQLEPCVIYKDDFDNINFYKDYNDYINQLRNYNVNVSNHDKINQQEFYACNPCIDWDKISNFREYYWLPYGPISITVDVVDGVLDIDQDIIGKKQASLEYPKEFDLSNGMRLKFSGKVFPEKYKESTWIVEGVGESITLVDENSLVIINDVVDPQGNVYDSLQVIPFDTENFDTVPFDSAQGFAAKKDYIVINRASKDKNPWSRYNRWFHIDVIKKSYELNDQIFVFDQSSRAVRPIIEFKSDLQLFNFGKQFKYNIDVIDTETTDIYSDIEGLVVDFDDPQAQIPKISGIEIYKGMTVIFISEQDSLYNTKIFTLDLLDSQGSSRVALIENDYEPEEGDSVMSLYGDQQGKTLYFSQDRWHFAQEKRTLNQQPLFDLYDEQQNSFADNIIYPGSSFQGSKIFSYQIGQGPVDSELNFPISYRNINNIGDIVFDFNLLKDNFTFKTSDTQESVTVNTSQGFVKRYVSEQDHVFLSAWTKADELSRQKVIRSFVASRNQQRFIIDHYDSVEALDHVDTFVYVNNILLFKDIDYTLVLENKRVVVEFSRNLSDSDVVTVKTKSDINKNSKGYYEIPINLERNVLNRDITTFTSGEINDHVQSIVEESKDFKGTFPGPGNLRDIGEVSGLGRKFVQHSGSLNIPLYHVTHKQNNIVDAIEFSKSAYSKFKRRFIQESENITDVSDIMLVFSKIMSVISSENNNNSPFYYSDMIPFKGELVQRFEITESGNRYYPLEYDFDYNTQSNHAVLVYLIRGSSKTQLLKGINYTLQDREFCVIDTDTTEILKGDVIEIREYQSTDGCCIPPTPSKLGIYPLYEPMIFTDYSYFENQGSGVKVIQGHDGSITRCYSQDGYQDYRDLLILELEKRIFNNIKVHYDADIFNLYEFLPGYHRKNNPKKSDIDRILVKDFNSWLSIVGNIDYTSGDFFDKNNKFTYNYSHLLDRENPIPGFWREIYRGLYDTDRPHSHPWEMLGMSIKPSWWEETYGPSPYTSKNILLWEDLEKGIIREPGNVREVQSFQRPGLMSDMPVDQQGNLVTPDSLSLLSRYVLRYTNLPFKFGDGAPVESSWKKSSEYPFALIKALLLNKPAQLMGLLFDRSRIYRNISGNLVYASTNRRVSSSDVVFPNYDSDNKIFSLGLVSFLVDYLKTNIDVSLNSYKQEFKNIENKLGFKLSGFADKNKFNLLLDSQSPSSQGSVFIPQENFEITMQESSVVKYVSYSGVIIEKTNKGYVISGYDKKYTFFRYFKHVNNYKDITVTVGGVSEEYAVWSPMVTYAKGQAVYYNNNFYRVTESHISASNIDLSKFVKLAELPTINGKSAIIRTVFDRLEEHELAYGSLLATTQDVVDFILGYEDYLKYQGFSFDEYNTETNLIDNWQNSVKQFLFWLTQNWNEGSLLSLSPGAEKLVFKSAIGDIGDIFESSTEYSLVNVSGRKIKKEYATILRTSDLEFEISLSNTTDGIYGLRLPIVYKEHAVVVDNKSVFNDMIYNTESGYRQERIKILGYRTAGWNGRVNIPGFLYDEIQVKEWKPWVDYNAGDVVKHKEYYYTPAANITGTRVFESSSWRQLGERPESKLIPNFEYKVNQFSDFYDLDTDNFDIVQQKNAQKLIGYQKREYLSSIINDEVSQYKFYQGFIADKGTKNAITKLFDVLNYTNRESLDFYEEWAVKVGDYGAEETFSEIEIKLDDKFMIQPSQPVVITQNSEPSYEDLVYRLSSDDVSLKNLNFDYNPFPQKYIADTEIKSAGYVRKEDVEHIVRNYDDILEKSISEVRLDDFIWVTFYNDTWTVLKYQDSGVMISGVKTQGSEVVLEVNSVDFKTGDIIGINGIQDLEGFFKIVEVGTSSITVDIRDTGFSEDLEDISAKITDFAEIRYSDLAQAKEFLNSNVTAKNVSWIDDIDGKWGIIKTEAKYKYKRFINQLNYQILFKGWGSNAWEQADWSYTGNSDDPYEWKINTDSIQKQSEFDPWYILSYEDLVTRGNIIDITSELFDVASWSDDSVSWGSTLWNRRSLDNRLCNNYGFSNGWNTEFWNLRAWSQYDDFGRIFKVSKSGDYLVVGLPDKQRVLVFKDNNFGYYDFLQSLEVDKSIYDSRETSEFGRSVAISDDNRYIVVGAPATSRVKTNFKGQFDNRGNYIKGDIVESNNQLFRALKDISYDGNFDLRDPIEDIYWKQQLIVDVDRESNPSDFLAQGLVSIFKLGENGLFATDTHITVPVNFDGNRLGQQVKISQSSDSYVIFASSMFKDVKIDQQGQTYDYRGRIHLIKNNTDENVEYTWVYGKNTNYLGEVSEITGDLTLGAKQGDIILQNNVFYQASKDIASENFPLIVSENKISSNTRLESNSEIVITVNESYGKQETYTNSYSATITVNTDLLIGEDLDMDGDIEDTIFYDILDDQLSYNTRNTNLFEITVDLFTSSSILDCFNIKQQNSFFQEDGNPYKSISNPDGTVSYYIELESNQDFNVPNTADQLKKHLIKTCSTSASVRPVVCTKFDKVQISTVISKMNRLAVTEFDEISNRTYFDTPYITFIDEIFGNSDSGYKFVIGVRRVKSKLEFVYLGDATKVELIIENISGDLYEKLGLTGNRAVGYYHSLDSSRWSIINDVREYLGYIPDTSGVYDYTNQVQEYDSQKQYAPNELVEYLGSLYQAKKSSMDKVPLEEGIVDTENWYVIQKRLSDQIDIFSEQFDVDEPGNTLVVSSKFLDQGNTTKTLNRVQIYQMSTFGRYILSQEINNPAEVSVNFGHALAVSDDGLYIAVSDPGNDEIQGRVYVYKRNNILESFVLADVLTSPETADTRNFGEVLEFSGSQMFVHGTVGYDADHMGEYRAYKSSLYIYERIYDNYIFMQKISSNVDQYASLGKYFAYNNNRLFIGIPEYCQGNILILEKDSKQGLIEVLREPVDHVDVTGMRSCFLYDTNTNDLLDYLDIIDPLQGKISGYADQEISYKTHYDPASYNVGFSSDLEQYSAWTEEHKGKLWWDLSTAKFLDHNQGDVLYSLSVWNKLAFGASIDVYEWTQSDVLPSVWDELAADEENFSLGYSGTSKYGDQRYVEKRIYDNEAQRFKNVYFFWVKNKKTIPQLAGRTRSAFDVSEIIRDPRSQGLRFVSFFDSSSFVIHNHRGLMKNQDTSINFRFWISEDKSQNIHSEYQIITEGLESSKPKKLIEDKWFDSLVGQDRYQRLVPDPSLSAKQRYGSRNLPRQSWFVNRREALKQFIDRVNSILKDYLTVDNCDISRLFSKDREYIENESYYDITLETLEELHELGTTFIKTAKVEPVIQDGVIQDLIIVEPGFDYVKSPSIEVKGTGQDFEAELLINKKGSVIGSRILNNGFLYNQDTEITVRPFRALITSDETNQNQWSVYEWKCDSKDWVRIATERYNIANYWEYTDWYLSSENDFTPDHVVRTLNDVNFLDDRLGQIIKVENTGSGGWTIFKKISDLDTQYVGDNYQTIARQNGTIRFLSSIYSSPDVLPEVRIILDTIKDNILVDDLSSEYNGLFLSSLRYALSEQKMVDWAFKTSFIKVKHNVGDLEQKINFKNDNLESFQEYLEEIKPYKTKIRQYVSSYTCDDDSLVLSTDFDVPPFYDADSDSIKTSTAKVSDTGLVDVNFDPTKNLNQAWVDNYTYYVSSIQVTDGGKGYTSEPEVIIHGTGTGAKARAFVANGSVVQVDVISPGQGYVKRPVVEFKNTLGNVTRRAKAVCYIDNDTTRKIKIHQKFDRVSEEITRSELFRIEDFLINKQTQYIDLKWTIDRSRDFKLVISSTQNIDLDYLVENSALQSVNNSESILVPAHDRILLSGILDDYSDDEEILLVVEYYKPTEMLGIETQDFYSDGSDLEFTLTWASDTRSRGIEVFVNDIRVLKNNITVTNVTEYSKGYTRLRGKVIIDPFVDMPLDELQRITVNYKKNGSLLEAQDRIDRHYDPVSGQFGKELSQLLDGVGSKGNKITSGLLENQETGWNTSTWYSDIWDSAIESTEEETFIIDYFIGTGSWNTVLNLRNPLEIGAVYNIYVNDKRIDSDDYGEVDETDAVMSPIIGNSQTVIDISELTDQQGMDRILEILNQRYKGGYTPSESYQEQDIVSYNQEYYQAIGNTTGNSPEDSDFWIKRTSYTNFITVRKSTADGSLYVSSSQLIMQGGSFSVVDSALGFDSSEYSLDGSGFVTDTFNRGPEELIPGQVTDTLEIRSEIKQDYTQGELLAHYKIFKDMFGDTQYFKIENSKVYQLYKDFKITDTTIELSDDVGEILELSQRGVVFINGERIEYFKKDGYVLSNLRRGTRGTSVKTLHEKDSVVYKQTVDELLPDKDIYYSATVTADQQGYIDISSFYDISLEPSKTFHKVNNDISIEPKQDQIDIFVGGRKLRKSEIAVYIDSRELDSPEADIILPPEFTVDSANKQVILEKVPDPGEAIVIVKHSSEPWSQLVEI